MGERRRFNVVCLVALAGLWTALGAASWAAGGGRGIPTEGGALPPPRGVADGAGMAPSDPKNLPPGLAADWWSHVRSQIQAEEYEVTWVDQTSLPGKRGAWQATNHAQRFRTFFTGEGIRVAPKSEEASPWQWGLTLVAWGRPGDLKDVPQASPTVSANRTDYARGSVREWYVNSSQGLEQGFTMYAPPAQSGALSVERGAAGHPSSIIPHSLCIDLALFGTLHPSFAEDGQAVDFYDGGSVAVLHYAQLKVTDATGRTLPSRFEGWVGALFPNSSGGLRIVIDDSDAVYPVTVDPLATSPSWTATGQDTDNQFGYSLATAGDVNGDGYSDVIVGAGGYGGTRGKAYLYMGGPSGLSTTAAWAVTGETSDSYYGFSVATAGDVNGDGYSDVVIGADRYNNATGKAYLYLGGPSGLSTTAAWSTVGEGASDWYACLVATAGDVNGDGYSDVVVGAYGYGSVAGKAYLYLGGPTGLSAASAWTAVGEGPNNVFGLSAGTAGDVNGDGYSDVVVGAHGYNGTGKAYLYLGGPTGLSTTAAWTAVGESVSNWYGEIVATAGDVNGDGYSDVVVGAAGYDSTRGKAYLYLGGPTGLSATASWTTTGEDTNNGYGQHVATAGDVNGDGYSDVVVGAFGYDGSTGKAYLYLGSATGLSTTSAWTAAGESMDSLYGMPTTAGDVNGDGFSDLVVGAYGYNLQTGKAYLYLGSASGPSATAAWMTMGEGTSNTYGWSVATAGDVNGDGYSDVVVGAYGYNGNIGKAYLYPGSASGLSTTASWMAAGEGTNNNFGYSVATAGDVNGDGYSDVVVSATSYGGNSGRTYLYLGGPTGLSATAVWTTTGEGTNNYYGRSVATAGDVNGDGYSDVVVGSTGYSGSTGKAYLYLGGPTGLSATASWTTTGEGTTDYYGNSVATAGDVNGDGYSDVLVGAHGYNSSTGKAYLYLGGPSGLSGTAAWAVAGQGTYNYYGRSVSTAGDVNGDGYSDVVVGANGYASGTGKAYLYMGGPAGLSATAAWAVAGEDAVNNYGISVSTAGDVNGDGYSDVLIGAQGFNNWTGKAYLYPGSLSGLSATAAWTAAGEGESHYYGQSAASAGDVNGDGFSDVVVGAYGYDSYAGNAYLYYGNGGPGVPMRPRQIRADGSAPIAQLGLAYEEQLRIGLKLRSPFGMGQVKLQWQALAQRDSFNPAFNPIQSETGWHSSGASGFQQMKLLFLPDPPGPYKWRARVRYNPVSSPFQQHGPWFTPASNGLQEMDLRSTLAAPPPACVLPDEPCWLYQVDKVGNDYTLNFQDPNQSNQRTGWNIRRSNDPAPPKDTWPIVGSNVVDMDQSAPNYQWTDHSGDDPGPGGVWYYEVTAYNANCPAEGPF